ncbi:sensor histidine kinase KdpD [Conexibacter sp. SYSU D00693]|uniref:sensor histidine kinase n=1 Tax=Conexibacter sp. SYSU D00693 TaxID=2812560 RepID=UPI00196AF173|nr:HAMP domain-containing sensor histidine kinase [Conexibacter sp. SYSU D00693]
MSWLVALCAVGVAAWLARARWREAERLARCAHEVRGPLTALSLALHGCARRGELGPARLAGLELELRRAALALDDLRGDARSVAGAVDLGALLERQVATWAEVARARGADVVWRGSADGGVPVVRGDAVRLAQAVGNVLGNAIEHGAGTVEVRTRAADGRVVVEVLDGGPGLPAPVASIVRRPRGGRGVRGRGLAIAAGVARRHGGRLVALPAPAGARLALELPAAEPAEAGS